MSIGIHNNIAMMNAGRQYKVNTGNKSKKAEKLASGYQINRAADNAAGLQISETMRRQIRGLNRGTKNAQDGISMIQVGDGALEEVHSLLQRMRELTVQSLNDTYTESDRAACQMEFDALQSEIDKITKTTEFNKMPVFDQHTSPYYQNEGNIVWEQSQLHAITDGSNTLEILYTSEGTEKSMTITVPAGMYTTQELMDEIDDSIIAQGLEGEGISVEFTREGTCNLNLENGERIDGLGGGLSYLFYKVSQGGNYGALIGTTTFLNEYVEIEISNENNHLEFYVEDFQGNQQHITLDVPNGEYTRSEMIDYLNQKLSSAGVTATAYGTGIRLEGTDSIVTGFKGNMFKVDSGKIYHSVFYDNVKYGDVDLYEASFTGGLVKPIGANQEEFQKYIINSTNNTLTFQPNGAATSTDFIIPDGEYTVDDIRILLNKFFQDNGMELEASKHSNGSYEGIFIKSDIKGTTSDVGLDATSSAYNTLFVTREYVKYGADAQIEKETRADSCATVNGTKEFTNISTQAPFKIIAGQNDEFQLNVNGTSYTITLDAGDYTTAQDILDKINEKLSDSNAPVGYKDKVVATLENNQIVLTAPDNGAIKTLTVGQSGANTGYEDLFVKTTVTYEDRPVTGTTVTLDNITTDSNQFEDGKNTLDVTVGNRTETIQFETGRNYTAQEIENLIETEIAEQRYTELIKFDSLNATGTTSEATVSISGEGTTTEEYKYYTNTGSSKEIEGTVGFQNNTPAQIVIAKELPSQIEITDKNNKLSLTINGKTETLTLSNNTYTQSALVNEIQSRMDAAFGTGVGGAKVSLSNGKLVFTANLKYPDGAEENGKKTSISCGTSSSSFLKTLFTTETAATATSTLDLQSTINITDDTNTFSFKYKENGVQKNVTLTLNNGSYDESTLVEELNRKLQAAGHTVTATLNGTKLQLTTKDVGEDTSITYSSATGGTSVEALFGDLTRETPASAVANKDIKAEITINQDSDQFNIKVNETDYNLALTHGIYTRQQFVDMLNNVFSVKNQVGVKVLLSSNKILYTTDETGPDASIELSYDSGGNAMKAIYGESTTVTPGVKATMTQNGLVLEATQNGTDVSVTPDGVFIKRIEHVDKEFPGSTEGYKSQIQAGILGVPISEPIQIDQYNNELKFKYVANGTEKEISITIPDGNYNFTSANGNTGIKEYLQTQIDTQVGTNQLLVSADENGICIQVVNTGSNYELKDFSGDFYKRVLCKATEETMQMTATDKKGSQRIQTDAYIVGRKDIRNTTTRIRQGINETLSLDLNYGGNTKTLDISLDTGDYSGTELIRAIQEKLDEKLMAEGLPTGMIVAQIGGVSTGVSGSNDANALVFKISPNVSLPVEGEYYIDGVRGSAAFTMFYQTEGEMEPAHVKGNKDISQGVTILPGETNMSFTVDGTEYQLDIAEGDYTTDEILAEINAQLQAGNAPVLAELEDNMLKISYQELGKHTISDMKGLAKDELFFSENGSTEPRQDIKIHLSANANDSITVEKHILNTSFLKINSCGITKPKYANKALGRIDDAINMVSAVRSALGSAQNRLSHAIANNQNAEENTVAAESRIRDTDMAATMVEFSRSSILEQVSQAMMAQARDMNNGILRLLE